MDDAGDGRVAPLLSDRGKRVFKAWCAAGVWALGSSEHLS